MQRYSAGCDVGSTTGKAVVLKEGRIVAHAIVPSRVDPEQTAREALTRACEQLPDRPAIDGIAYLVGTGYGRNEVPFAHENVSEITCHAVGAHHCDRAIRTLVDIGGQDVKAIAVNDDGTVREFAMNDKCAAGTGRFFEAMARIFQVDLDELSALALRADRTVPISSQCSVFAESEVVSLISKRTPPADIAAGVQAAIAKRVFSLARRVGVRPRLAVSGGCAKSAALRAALSRLLRESIETLAVDPQIVGALGAAVLAERRVVA